MSAYHTLSSPEYWSDATVRDSSELARITGMPDVLDDQVRLLAAQAEQRAFTCSLDSGLSLADAEGYIPLHLRENPWMLGVTIDTRRRGKVTYPKGLLMGRDELLGEAEFDEQAQKLIDDPVYEHESAAALTAQYGGREGQRYTIKRETVYCLGRTAAGEGVDCRVNGTASLPGLPGDKLGSGPAVMRDFTATIPLDTEIGAAYTTKSGRMQTVVAGATVIIPYFDSLPRGRRRRAEREVRVPLRSILLAPAT